MRTKDKDKPVKSKSGRDLTLTEGVKSEILKLAREGVNLTDIAKTLDINYFNLQSWRYYQIKDEYQRAELDYQLHQVEEFTNKLMRLDAGKKDSSLLAIQQKEAEFRRKYQVNAKGKYNDTPQIAIQVNLPSPIVDLGKLESE